MSKSHLREVLQFALSLSDVAEKQILPAFRNCTVSLKPDGSEVTDADRRAEEAMREIIVKRYPDHEVLGEEFGGTPKPTAKPQWILDPVDGTTSFAIGVPLFGTLIGYLENQEPVVGIMNFPALGETIFAAKWLGCWHKFRNAAPQRAAVSTPVRVDQAFVSACSAGPSDVLPPPTGHAYRLSALLPKVRKFRFITDCLQHGLVALGRIDAAIDFAMHPWDIAALVPCVEEAGGIITDLAGNRDGVVWKDSLLSSSNKELHSQIVSILS